jgi:hypothetical protein
MVDFESKSRTYCLGDQITARNHQGSERSRRVLHLLDSYLHAKTAHFPAVNQVVLFDFVPNRTECVVDVLPGSGVHSYLVAQGADCGGKKRLGVVAGSDPCTKNWSF